MRVKDTKMGITRLFVGISFLAVHVIADGPCGNNVRGVEIVPNSDDCSSYYICYGQQHFMFTCSSQAGHESLFDPVSRTCVPKGSIYDHSACHKSSLPDLPVCVPGVISTEADPDNCAKYYKCTGGSRVHKGECPYPRLYNRRTDRCELYLFVNCDIRFEPKDPCDYSANHCTEGLCVPCRSRYGSCANKPDGANPWEGKQWTPFYVLCKDERVLLQGDCRENNRLRIFHPVWRRCMTPFELMAARFL